MRPGRARGPLLWAGWLAALPEGRGGGAAANWGAAGPERGYRFTDPSAFGGFWKAEAQLEAELPPGACWCGGAQEAAWDAVQLELRENLFADPSFSGAWVHALCGVIHGVLFRFVTLDPETGLVVVQGTECVAGLASMAAVCAQSEALQARGTSGWQWHERTVREEGPSVGDMWGRVALADCMRLCEESDSCASFAHGPNGCHLKGRCSAVDDVQLEPESSAEGYRTYFLDPCPLGRGAGVPPAAAPSAPPRPEAASARRTMEELTGLVDVSLQLMEKAVHCADTSGWPFSVEELIENRIELVSAALGAGGEAGPRAEMARFRWSRQHAPAVAAVAPASASVQPRWRDEGPVWRLLRRSQVRWARRIISEVGFWHILLDPEGTDRSEEDAAEVRQWLASGDVRWTWDGVDAICERVADAQAISGGGFGPPRILNAGSGPLAPGPVSCEGAGESGGPGVPSGARSLGQVPVVAADGLGRFYMQLFDFLGQAPHAKPLHCAVEELLRCFPRDHFDVAHIRNALDHAVDPLLGIRQLLSVVRPGGWLLLRHERNEGVPGQFQLGLHQWAFDAADAPAGGAGQEPHFLVWSPALRADVSAWLLSEGLASQVITQLRPHPGRDAPGAELEYIWVDIQKAPL